MSMTSSILENISKNSAIGLKPFASVDELSFSSLLLLLLLEKGEKASWELDRNVVCVLGRTNEFTIITAQGDAIGANLMSDAFRRAGNGLIELRKLEAGEEIAQNLAGTRNVVYLPEGQGVLMNLP